MKKYLFLLIIGIFFFLGTAVSNAAEFPDPATAPITVYEDHIAVQASPSNRIGIYAEILGTSIKKNFLCPPGGCGAINVNLDIYQLIRGTAYTLRICDLDAQGDPDLGFNCPEQQFSTVQTDTRTGSGDWWFTTQGDLTVHPSNSAFRQFNTEGECLIAHTYKMFSVLRAARSDLVDGKRQVGQFTPCFRDATKPPTKRTFESRLKELYILFPEVLNRSATVNGANAVRAYFYVYSTSIGSGTQNFSGPFESQADCEASQNLLTTSDELILPCHERKDIPLENLSAGTTPGVASGESLWYFFAANRSTPSGGYETEDLCVQQRVVYTRANPNIAVGECYEGGLAPYNLLAPLPGLTQVSEKTTFSDYLNIVIRILIGLAIVAAVLSMVIGGMLYAFSDVVTDKSNGIKMMSRAIWGLVFALLSYLILNTINPRLVNNTISIDKATVSYIEVSAPEGGDLSEGRGVNVSCGSGSTSPDTTSGYCMFGTPGAPKPTGDIPAMIKSLESGYTIKKISIFTDNGRIVFELSDNKLYKTDTIGFGAGGIAEVNTGVPNDRKTPKGTWTIIDKKSSQNQSVRVVNGSGQSMGGAYFRLSPTTNGERGIGIHGNTKNAKGLTAGCVLMYNDDLIAIEPYIKSGIPVWIGTL